jgi:tetratricopeptide (TPR) repeat protein
MCPAVKIRVVTLCLAAIVVALATHLGQAPASVSSAARVPVSLSAEAVQTAASEAELARLIGVFEARVKEHTDALDYLFLAKLYLQRARAIGDLGSYTQAGAALERSLALYPSDPDALATFARLKYATHDFATAAQVARTLLAADPTDITASAILGDASLELGDYATARDRFSRLADQFPNAAAVNARLARLAFLGGDDERARVLADNAQDEARDEGAFGVDLAWYAHLRAQLSFDRGDYKAARDEESEALAVAPDYYVAEAGFARAAAALGGIDEAIAHYERAIAVVPQPEYLAALGDLYTVRGDASHAARAYDTVAISATLASPEQRLYDRQFALFYLEHDRDLARAVEIAQASLAQRPDVYGYDIYAWALYKTGHFAEAAAASDRALSLSTLDPRFHYHAGFIALAGGDMDRARAELGRALALGPAFDPLLAERARGALALLENIE